MLRISSRLVVQVALCFSLTSLSLQAETLSNAIKSCTEVENSLKRLVCFDGVAKKLNGYSGKSEELSLAAAKVNTQVPSQLKRESSLPTPQSPEKNEAVNDFGKPKPAKSTSYIDGDSLVGKVAAVKKLSSKKVIVTLDDGQEWLQTSSEKAGQPKVGDTVVITNGALSAFYMKVEGSKRRIRVKRVN